MMLRSRQDVALVEFDRAYAEAKRRMNDLRRDIRGALFKAEALHRDIQNAHNKEVQMFMKEMREKK